MLMANRTGEVIIHIIEATVTIYPEPSSLDDGSFDINAVIGDQTTVPYDIDRDRRCARVTGFTGTLFILW